MPVEFPQCVVPDTFRDGFGIQVTVQGTLASDGVFHATHEPGALVQGDVDSAHLPRQQAERALSGRRVVGVLDDERDRHVRGQPTKSVAAVGVRDGLPLLEDGSRGNADNVIWCTGYDAGFSWVDLPIFDEDGRPEHESGVATRAPGLYFVGLTFLHSLSSSMVHGVGRDAARVVSKIGARARAHHSGLQASA